MAANIYYYNWNLYLPPEGIFDSTCGYHALRNGSKMLKILNENNFKINESYINNIKSKSYDLKSKVNLLYELNIYRKQYNSNYLSRNDLKFIIKNLKLSKNIFIIYLDIENISNFQDNINLKNIVKQNSYKICFIYFKEFLGITHWIPIVLDKQNNDIYVHILDSYDFAWNGDICINKIINSLYPSHKKINYKKELVKGRFICFGYKFIEFLFLIISIYIFINGLFIKFKFVKKGFYVKIIVFMSFLLFCFLYLIDYFKTNYKILMYKYFKKI